MQVHFRVAYPVRNDALIRLTQEQVAAITYRQLINLGLTPSTDAWATA